MPLFDLVLEGGMWNAVEATGSVDAHFAALHSSNSLDEAVPVVVSVFPSLRPRALATRARLRFVLRLRFRLLLGLRRLGRRVSSSLERIALRHHRRRALDHSTASLSSHTGLTLLKLHAYALRYDVAEVHADSLADERIRRAASAGKSGTRAFHETGTSRRARGRHRRCETLRERGRRWLAVVLARARRTARRLVGRNLEYRATLSAVARLLLDTRIEVVVRHRTTVLMLSGLLLLLRRLRLLAQLLSLLNGLLMGRLVMVRVMRMMRMLMLRVIAVHVLVQSLVLAHKSPHHFRNPVIRRLKICNDTCVCLFIH